jgi:hypothetical protein
LAGAGPASGFAGADSAGFASAGLASPDAASAVLSAAGAVVPPRKSVAYQPDPLSWKPAAVSCLPKVAAPQAGQTVSGSSEIFCSTSLAWPQDAHL